MKQNQSGRYRLAIIIMIFCSISVLLALADRAPLHLEKNCPCIHFSSDVSDFVNGVLHSTSSGPYAYRIFIPYLATTIHTIIPFVSLVDIDLLLKIFFLILCQLTFYYYLINFFPTLVSFIGVLLLDILLSFTFSSILGPSIGENADLWNLIIFSIVLLSLYKNSLVFLLAALFIGTFNRETTLFLVPIIFLYDILVKKEGITRSVLAFIAVAIPYFGLRIFIHPAIPDWFLFEGIKRNIPFISSEHTSSALVANAHTIFLLGPLIVLSLINFNKHPRFLQIVTYITPLFIFLHYIVGSIIETRLWIPLFVILIPTSLNTLNLVLGNQHNSTFRYLDE